MSFIRFVVSSESDSPRTQSGLFTEIESLTSNAHLEPYQMKMVKVILEYFDKNLPVPTYSTKKWSIDEISWFKDSAINFIDRMRDLEFILEESGFRVRILKIDNLEWFYMKMNIK